MKEIALVIIAADIGSRFGGGIKQLESVGSGGEIVMDYFIHDATEAGFNKVIFIIRKDLEKDFKEVIGNRIEKVVPVGCAYQELDTLPNGYEVTPGRTKPWGTGQTVLVAKGPVDGPFLVTNADDYYGREGPKKIHDYMVNDMDTKAGVYDLCIGGSVLPNTLSSNGIVTRGVCRVDDNHILETVNGTYNIRMTEDGLQATDEQGNPTWINPDQSVSMNMWGILASFLDKLEKGFPWLLDSLKEGGVRSEYPPPRITDDLVRFGRTRVTVLDTPDKWFGVTYKEGKQAAVDAARKLIDAGVYKEKSYD